MSAPIGIDDLSFATTQYVVDHAVLADRHGVNVAKFHRGIGQESLSVPAVDEDIVTMAATAAAPILARHGGGDIRTVLLATETGVDQSKAAALYLHPLLGLPHTARVVELKQACYGATAALQMATALVARNPTEQVLVIATDIARYDLDTPAEATQGAAAVAMLVTADPAIVTINPLSGIHSADVMDFWRPNYRTTPLVNGRYSISAYNTAAHEAWLDYRRRGGAQELGDFAAFCYHQPFTKMAYKAHHFLLDNNGIHPAADAIHQALRHTTHYNRVVGNSYTASLYSALASLLDHADDLTDQSIAMISYGSGAVAEFFTATVVPGYRKRLRTTANSQAISGRKPIDYAHYRRLCENRIPTDDGTHVIASDTNGPYRLAAITDHVRTYETR